MTAPFELPDLVQIYDAAGTLQFFDVESRLVPHWAGGFMAVASGVTTGGRWFGYTHWCDMENIGFIPNAGAWFDDFRIDFDAPWPTLEMDYGGYFQSFIIMWTELRFTRTPKEYIRLYLVRKEITPS